jgi:hypothetical protein
MFIQNVFANKQFIQKPSGTEMKNLPRLAEKISLRQNLVSGPTTVPVWSPAGVPKKKIKQNIITH